MSPDSSVNSGIDFESSEETKLILRSLEEFVDREVKPVVEEIDEQLRNPRLGHETDGKVADDVLDAIDTIRKTSADAGFYAMNMPEEAGGDDVSAVTWFLANKQLAASGVPLADHVLAGPSGPKPLLTLAEGDQRERYLKPAMEAEKTTAFGQTEPGVGSDSPNMNTTAYKEGDEWVLNGTKQWITNAPYADFIQVLARTTPQKEAGRHGGITCFIVEESEYEIGSFNNAVGREGMQSEVHLDDVRIPEDRVLGEVDNAFYGAMEFLGLGRIEIGARSVGKSQWLIDQAIDYANEREAFGNNIGNYQGVAHKIAQGKSKVYAAETLGMRVAWELDQGNSVIGESSILKWFATNAFWEIADDVVQIHGGNGLSEDNQLMDRLLYARTQRIVEGTDEIQLNTIAKQFGVEMD